MEGHEAERLELNEVGWWSKWADDDGGGSVWPSRGSYALFSRRFDERFFNRGGFVTRGRRPTDESVIAIEREFEARKRSECCIFVQEGREWEDVRTFLKRRGYRSADNMAVMELGGGSFAPSSEVTVSVSRDSGVVEEWVRTYLGSFYGNLVLKRVVAGILSKVVKDAAAGLVTARVGGEAVGCAALYRTKGLLGVYCVGTLPSFRMKHVGSCVLGAAAQVAEKERRKLVLQTMVSDSAEGFYLKLGFVRVYAKDVFVGRLAKNG